MSHGAGALLLAALCASTPATAQEPAQLIELINEYRAAPQSCEGRRSRALPPLRRHPALSSLKVGAGQFLDQAIERAGYEVAGAQAITVSGAATPGEVMADISLRYCRTLLSRQLSTIGVSRTGASWQIVLAYPAPPPRVTELPGQHETGLQILQAVNGARSTGALCGERRFEAVAPLAWSSALSDAALAHSQDMATHRYLSHEGKDGRSVAERALQAQYAWRTVGENIAVGQESAADVVAGWISSPEHCANIMNPAFTDMGAAYAIAGAGRTSRAYWTQVFGKPR